ncbi:hypothetical protein MYX84_12580 [Acidobacteria bacterium AH-259-O06]|nr:hypothetical protein [Acidobacteria bacterium AH-259-L09]MDA2927876.1 hypothetical protein [Acidobacteria bacterium AH-259-G07]MDA2930758.1 hypothetical protein [Acidobacteria bacterium AH-259-O06]
MSRISSFEDRWGLLRTSVISTLLGMFCILVFLWRGFESWTVGLGIFLGVPLLLLGILLYLTAVIRDLRRRGAL